jgi:uncharacterized protein YqeY
MTQKEKVEKDYITAFKQKNSAAKNLLSVVKGEITTIEKNIGQSPLSDDEVNKILTKVAKNLKETISLSNDEESKIQLEIVNSYLPRPMSREEVAQKVSELVKSGHTNIGSIMKEFNGLTVDRKILSEIIKEKIN